MKEMSKDIHEKGLGKLSRFSRKKGVNLVMGALLITTGVLSGCSSASNSETSSSTPSTSQVNSESPSAANSDPGSAVTIRIAPQVFTPTDEKTATENTPTPRVALDKIIEDFQNQNPNITVEIVKAPTSSQEEYLTWMTTRIAAGDAPDIAWPTNTSSGWFEKGWLLPLDSYLEQPNPLGDPNIKWQDSFTNPELFYKLSDGNRYSIPIVQAAGSAVTFYYNIDIFDELNLKVPQTWGELLTALATIKEAGYIPAIPTVENKGPTLWELGQQVSIPILTNFVDEFNYSGAKTSSELKGDEYLRMVNKGLFSMEKPEFQEVWKLYKQWTQMWPHGWATQDMKPLWREGKVAIREGGMWELQEELSDTKRSFKWGVFPIPPVASDSTPFAIDLPREKGFPKNIGSTFELAVIKPTVEARGTTDAAIKFMQYLTTATVNEFMVNEIPFGRPVINGAESLPLFDAIKEAEYPIYPEVNVNMNVWINSEVRDIAGRSMAAWITDDITDESFFNTIQKAMDNGVKDIIKTQNIDTSKW